MSDPLTDPAPEGQIYTCAACGKASRTRSGFYADGKRAAIDRGWDESCFLHAVLCYSKTEWVDGSLRWVAVEPKP